MSAKAVLAGVDLGTTSVKTLLTTVDGEHIASASKEISTQTPGPLAAEQDPRQWLQAALECLRQVISESGVRPSDVLGLGLSGQMHSLVCLDQTGQVLRPAILWADRRSAAQAERLERDLGQAGLARAVGNPPATGLTLPIWAWLRENEPETAARTRTLLLAKDLLRYWLTGQLRSEYSDASATLLLDVFQRQWSAEMLAWGGLKNDQLPQLGESGESGGVLLPEMAAACGLPAGIPIGLGAGDQAAQAVGQGIFLPGSASCTIGTGGQVFAPLNAPRPDPDLSLHLFCHAIPNIWHLQAATLSAGLSLRWLRDSAFAGGDYSSLANAAAQIEAAADGLFFLPYLNGERTPHMNPRARGAFIGLRLGHTQANLTRAVMEGVVFSMRQCLERVEALTGRVEPLIVSGGATRHPLWLRLQADIFNRRLLVSVEQEAAALGAAILGGVAAGVYADVPAALRQRAVPKRQEINPDPERIEGYKRAYQQFIQLYPALAEKLW